MKPRVAIVLLKKRIHFFYQLQNLLGKYIDFSTYSIEEGISSYINCDLVLTPSNEAVAHIRKYLMPSTEVLVVRRTISRLAWQKLQTIPANSRVLVVSTYLEMSLQIIAVLYELGLNQFEFVPYNPEINDEDSFAGIEYAITPAELELVPSGIRKVIDMGIRLVDVSTLFDILNKLNLVNKETRQLVSDHLKDMVPLSAGFVKMFNRFYSENEQGEQLLQALNCGLITFDDTNRIQTYNQQAVIFFAGKLRLATDLPLARVFSCIDAAGDLLVDKLDNEIVQLQRQSYWLNKRPLFEKDTCIGGILTLQPKEENCNPISAKRTGHRAKHLFSDILGEHMKLKKTIMLAQKAASTNNDILIEGESGVGKELFAQAIHNASARVSGPFVAFNCAALSDTLLESELFGYEEGAFTGAQKKGRKGLFESANNGTIFLDEIAEISRQTQAKLLRVLQERELIRVGGNTIIPVNIRVIAASNRNLYDMVKNNEFRMDLYFRLNVINIRIPPLREHREDIPLLVQDVLQNSGNKKDVPQWLMDKLIAYDWPGNIRELKNCLQHILSLHDDFSRESLPPYLSDYLFQANIKQKTAAGQREERLVLEILKEAYERNESLGRKKLVWGLSRKNVIVTEQHMRTLLKELEDKALLCVLRGRAGTKITSAGLAWLNAEEKYGGLF